MSRSFNLILCVIAIGAFSFFAFATQAIAQSRVHDDAHMHDDKKEMHKNKMVTETSSPDVLSFITPYAFATAPNQKNGAAFGIIKNNTEREQIIVDIHGDVAERVEIHEMAMDDGIMKMRKLSSLTIPANGESTLEPGGNHIMFMGLKEPLEKESDLSLSLQFMDGTQQEISIPVVAAGQKPEGEKMDHDTQEHDHHNHMDHE